MDHDALEVNNCRDTYITGAKQHVVVVLLTRAVN